MGFLFKPPVFRDLAAFGGIFPCALPPPKIYSTTKPQSRTIQESHGKPRQNPPHVGRRRHPPDPARPQAPLWPPHAERPTSHLRCGSFCPSAKSYCRCRTMCAVDERRIASRPRGFSPPPKKIRAAPSSQCDQTPRNPPYSGVCIDRKKGNIAITMNSRVNIASCIVVVSTFVRVEIHRPFHYRVSFTRSPSHQSPRASHLSCREHRPNRSLIV